MLMFGTAPLQNGAVSMWGVLAGKGDVRIRESAIVLFFECRSESAKEKVERRKDAVLPEMGIRYFIFERTGRESGHVLRRHDIRFATDFKERVEYVCRCRGFVNWHQWNDCPGVQGRWVSQTGY